ncbi:poly(ethylene terephthalate) hydrolase family protein [Sorangium sp. So ce542]|uniref:poly(ethylene terephthalate) hydrolase family protein n=1 Tax=Sorangium sp. So ce542 TaxID=3133316 RepID=UPI003F61C654
MRRWLLALGVCVSTAACGNGSNGDAAASGGAVGTGSGGTGSGGTAESGGASSGGASSGGAGGSSGATGGAASGGQAGSGGQGNAGSGGQGNAGSGGTTGSGGSVSGCVGDPFPTADPTKTGPFSVTADKNVGPLAGVVPDPIYGDEQQRFNVYRPSNIATSGHCHPILIWANGYRDNPEQKPPKCVVNAGSNQWCGQYGPIVNHLASHGFVVVASLSTATAEGNPLPTTAGLDWILEQAEDASSPYYHALDTTKIGQLGHSYGGMSTCMTASDPRFSALGTICGTRALEGVHTPMLFFCGGKDSTVKCSGVHDVFKTVTDQPAFFLNELNADHGSWVYQGANGVSLSSAAAWFRVHLMDDTANRNFFYGDNCKFCTDGRVQAEQNALMKVP